MKKRRVLLLLWMAITGLSAFAQTWGGSESNDWNTAANWTPATVPGASSTVNINNMSAPNQPLIPGNVNITTLNMSAGVLNLNGYTITCTGAASLTGDSLLNGKIVAASFSNIQDMRMGGKIIFDKTGAVNNFWGGNNKVYNDSLIVIWRSGTLHLESEAADSIFSHLKIQIANSSTVSFSENYLLYVQNNLIIDNTGNGTFSWNSAINNIISGNLVTLNFSNTTTNLILKNITTLGNNANGPFKCYSGSISNCIFNGNFTLIADSSASYEITNSSFPGADNLFQALAFNAHDNLFGQAGPGTTILRSANNTGFHYYTRFGNNKYFGNAQLETYAAMPAGITIQQTYYGKDSCWGNLSFILKGNAALTTNTNGISYVAGNVIIDGQGAKKWVEFTGGTGNFNIGGNFTVKNFTRFSEPGVGTTNVHLRNVYASGNDTCGTFYCYSGDITNCSFNGNFKVIADSTAGYDISNSSFLGAENLFQAAAFTAHDSRFGQAGPGITILRSANNTGSHLFTRFGNNKFFGDAQLETYAVMPAGVTIQQTFYGKDSCWGNLSYILKGNAALTTNTNGISYVAGNVIIDGQGAKKWVEFTGGTGNFNIGGNFTVKNFTRFSEPGVGNTNVQLHNVYASGTDTCGTFYCYSGDIQNSSFNGNFKLIADSSQTYIVNNSFFGGADNLFESGSFALQNNRFGQTSTGTTILKAAHNVAGTVYIRDGNNNFLGDLQWYGYTTTGALIIQQTFYGQDSCFGNASINLSGASSANLAGNNLYLAKGLSLNNNGTGSIVHNSPATGIHFIGTDTANYSYSGSGFVPSILNIEMNRKGGLRLQSPLTYSGNLAFTRGIILSSASNPLRIPNGAAVSAAWDSSYADGPVIKMGNTAFTFPTGKYNMYAPIGITAPELTTDEFSARYFKHIAHNDGYDSTQHDVSLNHLSRAEYWLLDRTAGTSSSKVTLSWKTLRSGPVDVMPDLRVARWNGTTWKDEGNGTVTGTNGEGTIQTLNSISSFSPFTLASSTINNPLPVVYIYFTVSLQQNHTVLLKWETGEEINNAYFEIERSNDVRTWSAIGTINSNVSHQYSFADMQPVKGVNYYRIKQVDQNRAYSYTTVRLVRITSDYNILIWPNPVTDNLYIQTPFAEGIMEITDASGRVVRKEVINSLVTVVPVQRLAKGIYIIRVRNKTEVFAEKFIKE